MPAKLLAACALLALSIAPAFAAGDVPKTIDIKGQAIPLTCGAWKKLPDGSWTMVGEMTVGGASLSGLDLKGGKEVEALNAMCK